MFEAISALIMIGSGLFLIIAPIVSFVVAIVATIQLFKNRQRAKKLFLWSAGISLVPLTMSLGTFLLRNYDQLPEVKSAVTAARHNAKKQDPKGATLTEVEELLKHKLR